MKRIAKTPQFYFRRSTFFILGIFGVFVAIVLYYGLKPTTFHQPTVAAFQVSCPTISLARNQANVELHPSEGYVEGSGMVASRQNRGIFWVHSDELLTTGQSAVWAVNEKGDFVARYQLPLGLTLLDTEDIALGPVDGKMGDFLYLGAIGDNGRNRGEKQIVRFPEPVVVQTDEVVTPQIDIPGEQIEKVSFSYVRVEGSKYYDGEALIVDPVSGNLYIFSKTLTSNRGEGDVSLVFKLDPTLFKPLDHQGVISVEPVAAIRGRTESAKGKDGPTSAAISFDGSKIALVNRSEIVYWERPEGKSVEEVLINSSGLSGSSQLCISDEQARNPESITFNADGIQLYTISEKFNARLYIYDITTE